LRRFEHGDKPIAVYGAGDKGAGLALMMKRWSDDVILLTDGLGAVTPAMHGFFSATIFAEASTDRLSAEESRISTSTPRSRT
jgi:hypothetical protein